MQPNDRFCVEDPATMLLPRRDRSPCLPCLAAPIAGEALPAWLLRFAEPLHISPEVLLFDRADATVLDDPSWWRHPDPFILEKLAARTGARISMLQSMTFGNWTPSLRTDETTKRFSRFRARKPPPPSYLTRRYGVCVQCMANDVVPYVRKHWTLGWVAMCSEHRRLMVTGCEACRTDFIIPSMRSRNGLRSALCSTCWSKLPTAPARHVHSLALELQAKLLRGRDVGAVAFPSIGTLEWPTAIALIDLLLGVIWIGPNGEARYSFLQRIEQSLSLPERILRESYDGLLLAA